MFVHFRLLRKKQRQKANKVEDKDLTQEELLEEAKETEKLNIASLKRYEQMELEARKKAVKSSKRSVQGPFIRYLSTAMPLVQEVEAKEEKISVDDDVEDSSEKKEEEKKSKDSSKRHERTFLTFSDFATMRSTFPQKKPKNSQQKICPITRLPAKYVDPVTRLPYANLQAFKFLREHYYNQLELKGNKDDPEVSAWLDWRKKNKPSKPTHLTQVNRTPAAFTRSNSTSLPSQVTLPTHPTPPTTGQLQGLPGLAAAIRQGSAISSAASPGVQQQSVVLPVRTTPLGSTISHNSAATPAFPSGVVSNNVGVTAALPTQPSPTVQTVKISGASASHVSRRNSFLFLK